MIFYRTLSVSAQVQQHQFFETLALAHKDAKTWPARDDVRIEQVSTPSDKAAICKMLNYRHQMTVERGWKLSQRGGLIEVDPKTDRPLKGILGSFEAVPRPSGFSNEHNDCVVRALANATGMSYEDAHVRAAAAGRRPGKACSWDIVCAVFDPAGERHWLGKRSRSFTLARFLRTFPKGVFMVHINRHVFTVRDGVVLDTAPNGMRTRVDCYWAVAP
jgi:hypothetical protein